MSSTWYVAVCDEHKVFTDVMVNDPLRSAHLLGDVATPIKQWLIQHYGCELRLAWRDDQMDALWAEYKRDVPAETSAEHLGVALIWAGAQVIHGGKVTKIESIKPCPSNSDGGPSFAAYIDGDIICLSCGDIL